MVSLDIYFEIGSHIDLASSPEGHGFIVLWTMQDRKIHLKREISKPALQIDVELLKREQPDMTETVLETQRFVGF